MLVVLLLTGIGAKEAFSMLDPGIPWFTIDNGTCTISTGGGYELSGAIGQPDATGAAAISGGPMELTGGFWAVTLPPVWCLGDSDCSGGTPDFADINYFVLALQSETAWQDHHILQTGQLPRCPYLVNDINGGGVDFTDIESFIQHLGQPCDPL
jgi:hypothetical protein